MTFREPFHNVPTQLNTLMPVGMAIIIVKMANTESAIGPSPTENMWCAQTPKPMKAMEMPEKTTTG